MTDSATSALLQPASLRELADGLRSSTGSVLVVGGQTKLEWAGEVSDPDLRVDTSRLTGVITHNPADMTASVHAGTSLAALQAELADAHQWLALDPATESGGATLGGLLAAGDSGPSRLRYGGLRDLVIGVTLVLADGSVARSGGHVIKNVAGYDLAKLVYGSLGTLAVIAEVVVRLHPRPVSSRALVVTANADQATTAATRISASPLEPTALEWVLDSDGGRLEIQIDGTSAHLDSAVPRMISLLADLGLEARQLAGAEVETAKNAHQSAVLGSEGELVFRISALPTDLRSLEQAAQEHSESAGLTLGIASSVALGLTTVRLGPGSIEAQAQAFSSIRDRALALGASVLVQRRPAGLSDHVDLLGPAPSPLAVLRGVKEQFDPAGRLGPGRFQPWY